MTQEIIVFVILAGALGWMGYKFYHRFFVKKSSACGGCNGCDVRKDAQCASNSARPSYKDARRVKS